MPSDFVESPGSNEAGVSFRIDKETKMREGAKGRESGREILYNGQLCYFVLAIRVC